MSAKGEASRRWPDQIQRECHTASLAAQSTLTVISKTALLLVVAMRLMGGTVFHFFLWEISMWLFVRMKMSLCVDPRLDAVAFVRATPRTQNSYTRSRRCRWRMTVIQVVDINRSMKARTTCVYCSSYTKEVDSRSVRGKAQRAVWRAQRPPHPCFMFFVGVFSLTQCNYSKPSNRPSPAPCFHVCVFSLTKCNYSEPLNTGSHLAAGHAKGYRHARAYQELAPSSCSIGSEPL